MEVFEDLVLMLVFECGTDSYEEVVSMKYFQDGTMELVQDVA